MMKNQNIEKSFEKDDDDIKSKKYITNANLRENGQRNYILKGLEKQMMMTLF